MGYVVAYFLTIWFITFGAIPVALYSVACLLSDAPDVVFVAKIGIAWTLAMTLFGMPALALLRNPERMGLYDRAFTLFLLAVMSNYIGSAGLALEAAWEPWGLVEWVFRVARLFLK